MASKIKEQKHDYDGTSYCKIKGRYENYVVCRADRVDCRFYELMRKKNGTYVGACRKRYDRKQQIKKQEEKDIKNTLDISTYTGRRNS